MKSLSKVLFLFLSLAIWHPSQSQDFRYRAGVSGHYGFLWPHRSIMQHLVTGHTRMLELSLEKKTLGVQTWEVGYGLPTYGINLKIFDLANPGHMGLAIGSSVFANLPLLQTPHLRWNIQLGWGPGVVTKIFDKKDNTQNVAIGSHFNAFLMAATSIEYRISPRLVADASVSFNHFSNGALRMPNLGINIPVVGIGMKYAFQEAGEYTIVKDTLKRQPSFWALSMAAGMKEISPNTGAYPAVVTTFERNIGLSRKSSIAPGVDVFYNTALLEVRSRNNNELSSPAQNVQIGGSLMYNLHIGNVIVLMGLGSYLYDTFKTDGRIYNRIGIRYFPTENWMVHVSLKTHKFRADYPEIGFTYVL